MIYIDIIAPAKTKEYFSILTFYIDIICDNFKMLRGLLLYFYLQELWHQKVNDFSKMYVSIKY